MATAYLTVLLILAYYLKNYLPSRDLNHIDRKVLDFVESLWTIPILREFPKGLYTKRPHSAMGKHKDVLEKVTLAFSDQQVITGLALLLAGFSQLSCNGINAYHWQTMIFTVWFSSLTHIATLATLRDYFQKQNKKARFGRVILMSATLGLLLAALFPTANIYFQALPGVPAQCFYHTSEYDFSGVKLPWSLEYLGYDDRFPSVLFSAAILLISYISHMLRLFGPAPKRVMDCLSFSPSKQLHRFMKFLERQPKWALWWHLLADFSIDLAVHSPSSCPCVWVFHLAGM